MIQEAVGLLIERWDFFSNLLFEHLLISVVAIVFATIIGVAFGIFISEYEKTSKLTLTVVNLLYTIPSLALLGFLIPFTGVGNITAIIALTIYGLLPMVKNTHTGISNIDKEIIEAATGMGCTRFQLLWKIKLPLAFPVIMSGFRNMVTMTIAMAAVASFIGAGGLGVAIFRGITTNNMPMVLAGSALVALLAIVVDLVLGALERATQAQRSKKGNKRLIAVGIAALLLIVTAFSTQFINKNSDNTIRVADKAYTEQLVLGEVLSQLIEYDTDLKVELSAGLGGGTSVIQPALLKGEYDLYPEYTGTAWNAVLSREEVYQESMFDELQGAYEEMGLTWVGKYGFNNTYGIAVNRSIAEQYDLKTYSDLVAVAPLLTIGAEYDFYERPDGYYALCDAYGFNFASTMDLDTGLKYKAIASGQVDALIIYTTDGQLADSDVVILEDDRGFFPSYQASTVVRKEVLDEHPELYETLMKLDGVLDEEAMARLNYQVDTEGRSPHDVAQEFLVSSGLVEGENS